LKGKGSFTKQNYNKRKEKKRKRRNTNQSRYSDKKTLPSSFGIILQLFQPDGW
jgi:hypothetical protein